MNLCQAYYIEKRKGDAHIDLNGEWSFCWCDDVCETPQSLSFDYKTQMPSSVYYSLYHAGILPNPYYGTNSKQYHWVDDKIWYYRKTFRLDKKDFKGNAFLCFDGVAYHARVWVNGVLIGHHEGMFGGPCCDVFPHLNFDGENEIIVEFKVHYYGHKEERRNWNLDGKNIVPWNISRDTVTSNGDFVVMGIWNDVRLELVPTIHLSRPYLSTDHISDREAELNFEVEIADGTVQELRQYFGLTDEFWDYTRAYDFGLSGAERDQAVEVEIEISAKGEQAFYSKEKVPLTDFEKLGVREKYRELQFYQKKIRINNPKLWYPNGLGEPFLYDVTVNLWHNNQKKDTHTFKYGIRTFTAQYTKGRKYQPRWDKYLFAVNGKEFFLKGMNWTPIDFLYDINPERYEWCLTLAKNAGIQLLRVWNGGGMPETDAFYEICDRLGIMVWQDLFLANTGHSQNYPQDVLECQITYNLYRIRNHSSLVILCGGNEFNPYAIHNAASMFVMQRNAETLVPDRIYYCTTPDKGSAHVYNDMEPVWYRHKYKQIPFLAESGIHSFPCYKTIKQLVREEEATAKLYDLSAPEFAENFPDLLNHFTEYVPDRVPRMMSRNSQITDVTDCNLEEMCEASQVQGYEFYQLMIQSMQENFPVCGGIMPWVFKRPWTTVGIQTVDGDDRPGIVYYSVQNAYRNLNVCWCQQWSILAPNEEIPLCVKVFNQDNRDLSDAEVVLTIFSPDLTVFSEYRSAYSDVCDFGSVKLTDAFTDTCFLVSVDVYQDKVSIARSVYFNKCLSLLSDGNLLEKMRTDLHPNLYFENEPRLKKSVQNAKNAKLKAEITDRCLDGKYHSAEILLTNISDVPAYPVTVDLTDDKQRAFLSENFFMLMSGEKKKVKITVDKGEVKEVTVSLWNGNSLTVS